MSTRFYQSVVNSDGSVSATTMSGHIARLPSEKVGQEKVYVLKKTRELVFEDFKARFVFGNENTPEFRARTEKAYQSMAWTLPSPFFFRADKSAEQLEASPKICQGEPVPLAALSNWISVQGLSERDFITTSEDGQHLLDPDVVLSIGSRALSMNFTSADVELGIALGIHSIDKLIERNFEGSWQKYYENLYTFLTDYQSLPSPRIPNADSLSPEELREEEDKSMTRRKEVLAFNSARTVGDGRPSKIVEIEALRMAVTLLRVAATSKGWRFNENRIFAEELRAPNMSESYQRILRQILLEAQDYRSPQGPQPPMGAGEHGPQPPVGVGEHGPQLFSDSLIAFFDEHARRAEERGSPSQTFVPILPQGHSMVIRIINSSNSPPRPQSGRSEEDEEDEDQVFELLTRLINSRNRQPPSQQDGN